MILIVVLILYRRYVRRLDLRFHQTAATTAKTTAIETTPSAYA
jgi:hypothetical protein